MEKLISLSVPNIKGNEWQYIKECLDTEWVSSLGKFVTRFEDDMCKFTGAKYAIACTNGTAALQVALRVAGVLPNDEVLVPTITFIAPVNVIKYLNAEPIFMDCDRYYNIDTAKTIEFIKNETYFKDGYTYNKLTNKRISALIPVHIFGCAVDLGKLLPICKERNIKIVEDGTESLGTFYSENELKGRATSTIGDLGCLSFNGNKIITTGGGGMILTNNEEYAKKSRYLTTQAKNDELYYVHDEIGYNFRLTNIQAAMGVAQLERLPEFLTVKKKNYAIYKEAIDKIPGLYLSEAPSYANCNYWMYCLQINKDVYGKDRDGLLKFLSENKIQTRPLWYPNHLQKPYKNNQNYKIEKALDLYSNTLNIPCSSNLTEKEVEIVISKLKK
jgi:perosamine synthetase